MHQVFYAFVLLLLVMMTATAQTKVPQGWQASEEAVYFHTRPQAPKPPRYVYFATHGFFLGDSTVGITNKADSSLRFQRADNPLMQSGIVLAGGKLLSGEEAGRHPDRLRHQPARLAQHRTGGAERQRNRSGTVAGQ